MRQQARAGRGRRGDRRRPAASSRLVVKRRLILLIGFHRAQPRDIFLMLLVGLRKSMAAGAVGDEIEFARARRIGRGFERGAAGIGDRSGRQAVDDIGVVGRRLLDLAFHDRPAERALAADQAINDRRIGLQLHFLLEPVDEDGGDPRALLGLAGFLLDERGENDELIRRLDRQVGRTVIPDFLDHSAAAPAACAGSSARG